MTLLPPKPNLVGLNQTQGVVRTALGDFRDMVEEALGTSGLSPLINNATLTAAQSIAVGSGLASPGTTLQVFGSAAITDSASPAQSPGSGSLLVSNLIAFGSNHAQKLSLIGTSNAGIGTQPNTIYMRTSATGGFSFFLGGVHHNTQYNPGTGGTEILRVNNTQLLYKGQPVYTQANSGSLANRNTANTWTTGLQEFSSSTEVRVRGQLTLGSSTEKTPIVYDWGSGNNGVLLRQAHTNNASIGVQGVSSETMYIRAQAFSIFSNGVHEDTYRNPGAGGTELLNIDGVFMRYKGDTVLNTSMYGHRSDSTGINADMLDGLHGSSYLTRTSSNRPGTLVLYRHDSDVHQGVRLEWSAGEGRFRLRSWDISNGNNFNTGVEWADVAQTSAATTGMIRASQLHRASASVVMQPATPFVGGEAQFPPSYDIHQHTFATPVLSGNTTGRWVAVVPMVPNSSLPHRRWMPIVQGNTTTTGGITCQWDYLTNSGNPDLWVAYENSKPGTIVSIAEAEDSINEDGSAPIHLNPEKYTVLKVNVPTIADIIKLYFQLITSADKAQTFAHTLNSLVEERKYGMEFTEEDNLVTFMQAPEDEDKKQWNRLMVLRALQNAHYSDTFKIFTAEKLLMEFFELKDTSLVLK